MLDKYFFELSGEHPYMPSAEVRACIKAESGGGTFADGPGYAVAEFDDSAFRNIASRIALTRKMGRYLGSFDPSDGLDAIRIPEGTFAVRTKRFEGMMPGVDSQDITKKLGKTLSAGNDVSLKDPDLEIRVLISDKMHVFICDASVDADQFEKRKVNIHGLVGRAIERTDL